MIGLIHDLRGSYTPVFAVFSVLFCATALTAQRLLAKPPAT
jgi:hypothetical protein